VTRAFWATAIVLIHVSCGGAAVDAKHPPLPAGCPVQIFENVPPMATENIGTARARCAADVSRDDCIRELKDQACKLGANVIWGADFAPRVIDEKNEWSGRAAHTK
jgi:hypothetical protein